MAKQIRHLEKHIRSHEEHDHDDEIIKQAMMDSGATIHLNKPSDGLPHTGPLYKEVSVANGQILQTLHMACLPLTQLKEVAQCTHILPGLACDSLMSVKVLADNGYTTIFHPDDIGVTVHDSNNIKLTSTKPLLLQGWRNDQGLWMVPLALQTHDVATLDLAANVYDLPST